MGYLAVLYDHPFSAAKNNWPFPVIGTKFVIFDFPVYEFDFRFIFYTYLTMQRRSGKCFQNNLPGPAWVIF